MGRIANAVASFLKGMGSPRLAVAAYRIGLVGIASGLLLALALRPTNSRPAPPPQPLLALDSITLFRPAKVASATEPLHVGRSTPDPARGRELFASLGCADCHGKHAEGMGGEGTEDEMTVPTLAQTQLPLQRLIAQVRHPHEYMRSYSVREASDADLADIYAYLQTLPMPATVVPSVLSQVPPAPTGTLRGTVYYAGTHMPVPNFDLYLVAVERTDNKFHYVYDTWFQPATTTDAHGVFEMPLIREGDYVLFESRRMEEMRAQNGKIAVAQVRAGQTTEVEVFVSK